MATPRTCTRMSLSQQSGYWSMNYRVVTLVLLVFIKTIISTNNSCYAFRMAPHETTRTPVRLSQRAKSMSMSKIPNHHWTILNFQSRRIKTTSSSFPGSVHPQQRSSRTVLSAFLPPSSGGGGNNNNNNSVSQLLTTVLGVGLVVAFFASPLGALFFAVFNSLLLLSILIPVLGWAAFQFWQIFFTISGSCPNCGSPVRVAKDETPSFCFTCGSIIQARDDQICLANLNNNRLFAEEQEERFSVFSSFFDDMSGIQRRPRIGSINGETPTTTSTTSTAAKKPSSTTTIIDVDAERDD